MKSICLLTIALTGALLSPRHLLADNPTNGTSMMIQSVSTTTKGFPCILKITANGPGALPAATLYDETLPIQVKFVSITNDRTYTLTSSRGNDLIITTPEGDRRDSDKQEMWFTTVEAGKQKSILVDLASIRPELGRGTLLDDIPPGEYGLSVSFPGKTVQSNSIQIRIVPPGEKEQQFLTDILRQGTFNRGKNVNWSKVLRNHPNLSPDKLDLLSPTTKEQVAFHMLLSELTSKKTLGATDEDAVKTTPLPKFLEPEKECLLYEVGVATGKRDEAKSNELTSKYPDLQWRLQEIKANGKTFLLSKKTPTDKSK